MRQYCLEQPSLHIEKLWTGTVCFAMHILHGTMNIQVLGYFRIMKEFLALVHLIRLVARTSVTRRGKEGKSRTGQRGKVWESDDHNSYLMIEQVCRQLMYWIRLVQESECSKPKATEGLWVLTLEGKLYRRNTQRHSGTARQLLSKGCVRPGSSL